MRVQNDSNKPIELELKSVEVTFSISKVVSHGVIFLARFFQLVLGTAHLLDQFGPGVLQVKLKLPPNLADKKPIIFR